MGVKQVGIVGAGHMGTGVAEVAAKAGLDVTLRSRNAESARAARAAIAKSLARQVERGRLDESAADEAMTRIRAVGDLGDLASCDLVLEAVVEDLPTKKALFTELDAICQPDTILASNTSTLPIIELAMVTGRADRVCGIHFFNPAPVMALVEVARALTTSDETMDDVRAFVEACGKTGVTVKDQAGFVVNALLFPYLNNAVKLFDGGVATREDIDAAMKGGCNFPMGPLELIDLVGLDVSLAILDALHKEFGDPNFAPALLLRRMVAAGRLGRKTGVGFYDYAS